MKKIIYVLPLIILLSSFAVADIHLLSPLDTVVRDDAVIAIGSVTPGQSFEISASPKISFGARDIGVDTWDRLEVIPTLPANWEIGGSELSASVLTVNIKVPKDAFSGQYYIKLRATDLGGDVVPSNITAIVSVVPTLSTANLMDPVQTINQGEIATYTVEVLNPSIAQDRITITTDLPSSWYTPLTFTVSPSEKTQVSFNVIPSGSGSKDFKINLVSEKSGLLVNSSDARVVARTTLKGSLNAPNQGPHLFPLIQQPLYNLIALLFWWM